MSGAGEVADYSQACGIVQAKLFGFGINSAELRGKHIAWLNNFVVPVLLDGGSVTLVGEASRTGSSGSNRALSLRRAQSVLTHLQKQVGIVRSRSEAVEVGSVSGVGESAAAAAGLRDGTEAAFYRAVRIRAWGKLTPPDPLELRTDVPQTVQRVISRSWSNTTIRSPGGKEDGETGAGSAELFAKIKDTATKQGSDTRVYHGYPPDYVVVAVHEDRTLESLRAPINTTINSLLIHYEWGPSTPGVTLFERSSMIIQGGSPIVHTSINVYSRSEIWKHTIAPNQAVFK